MMAMASAKCARLGLGAARFSVSLHNQSAKYKELRQTQKRPSRGRRGEWRAEAKEG